MLCWVLLHLTCRRSLPGNVSWSQTNQEVWCFQNCLEFRRLCFVYWKGWHWDSKDSNHEISVGVWSQNLSAPATVVSQWAQWSAYERLLNTGVQFWPQCTSAIKHYMTQWAQWRSLTLAITDSGFWIRSPYVEAVHKRHGKGIKIF